MRIFHLIISFSIVYLMLLFGGLKTLSRGGTNWIQERLITSSTVQTITNNSYFHSTARLFLSKNQTKSTTSWISKSSNMKIIQVPVLSDNYSYLLIDEKKSLAAAVDPAEPEKVIEAAKKEKVSIVAILTTHHHWDHAGGNEGMVKSLGSSLIVYGGDKRVNAVTHLVGDNHSFEVGLMKVTVHSTPCHTSGHVLYEVRDSTNPQKPAALFTGDTLFVAGCGRFFEGTAEQMHHALVKVIAQLPEDTEVYCGHEYTVKNLEFAKTIEPNNEAVLNKLSWAKQQSEQLLSTVPSTVGEEKTYNPFMRCVEKSVAEAVQLVDEKGEFDPVRVLAELRKRKDAF